jgi:hypothetical protein
MSSVANVRSSGSKRWAYGTFQQPYFFLGSFNDTLTNAWVTYHQGTVTSVMNWRGRERKQLLPKQTVLSALSWTEYRKPAGKWTRESLNIKHSMQTFDTDPGISSCSNVHHESYSNTVTGIHTNICPSSRMDAFIWITCCFDTLWVPDKTNSSTELYEGQ